MKIEWYSNDVAPVKSVRHPTLRQEKAELTRRRILGAARRLFGARGYGATTLAAVAEDADVAVQTVYAVFGSKPAILRALRESVVRDPSAEQRYADALTAGSPRQALELFAGSIRTRWQAGYDIVAMDLAAASSDSRLRREVEAVFARRRAGLLHLARSLERDLRPGVTVDRAAGVMDALTHPAVYMTLVATHGWSAEEYESWLASSLERSLIR